MTRLEKIQEDIAILKYLVSGLKHQAKAEEKTFSYGGNIYYGTSGAMLSSVGNYVAWGSGTSTISTLPTRYNHSGTAV